MFLTAEEIRTLTGYKRAADQCSWLEKRGWTFERSAAGAPVVSRSHAEMKLGGDSKATPGIPWAPDFAGLQ